VRLILNRGELIDGNAFATEFFVSFHFQ